MLAGDGSLLCLATIVFGAINSGWHLVARYPHPRRWQIHTTNVAAALLFAALATVGAGTPLADSPPLLAARLLLPIIYFWIAYAWAGTTLHVLYPPDFSFDRPIIAVEQRWFGNPSLWMARGRPAWLHELMGFFYWSYFFYIPALGIGLAMSSDWQRFEAMAMATSLAFLISYGSYPLWPLWGPRWALVSEGLLPQSEQVIDGYAIQRFMNRIIWSDTAHKGGAMPSAHSAICIVFFIWCVRIWGLPGALVGGVIAVGMFVSTVYGRYHYVVDVIVGVVFGLAALGIADALVLGR